LILLCVRSAIKNVRPQAEAPIKEDPAQFMVHQAEKVLPPSVQTSTTEGAAEQLLGLGYGMTFGTLYSSMRPSGTMLVRDGVLLGLGTWAAGYLGWLPATGLMPPVWKHRVEQFWVPVAEHVLFGVATAASYHWLANQAKVAQ
jgi:hypothetical protein